VFGPRFLPPDRCAPEQLGIDGLDAFPRRLWQQILAPWRWQHIERAGIRTA
jgi:hypothetical protein